MAKKKKISKYEQNKQTIRRLIKKKKVDKEFATYNNDNAVGAGE